MTSTRTLIGFHAVISRLRQHAESVESVYVDATRQDARMRDLAARANTARVTVHAVDAARLATLAGNAPHQGVVAIVDAQRPHVTVDDVLSDLAEPALLLVLDGVTDPHNLGACLQRGVWVLGADEGGESLFAADVSGPVAWVLGAEGQGLRRLTRESCDRLIGIPLAGAVESLNVSVAAGICLYATRATRSRTIAAQPAVG